jgi:hypothetical protein
MRRRHMAFSASINTITRHRIFSPRLFAAISHNSSVYCAHCNTSATRLYTFDFPAQYFVYRLCGFGMRGIPGSFETARASKVS